MFSVFQICQTESKQNLRLVFGEFLEIRDSVAKDKTKELGKTYHILNDLSLFPQSYEKSFANSCLTLFQ
jgi:hypothetical protein